MGGSGEGAEWMISWIWVVPARAVGMGFADSLGVFEESTNRVFSDPPLFIVFVFCFERGAGN